MVCTVLAKSLCPHNTLSHIEAKAKQFISCELCYRSLEQTRILTAQWVAYCVEMSREVLHDNVLMKIKYKNFVWPLSFFLSRVLQRISLCSCRGTQTVFHWFKTLSVGIHFFGFHYIWKCSVHGEWDSIHTYVFTSFPNNVFFLLLLLMAAGQQQKICMTSTVWVEQKHHLEKKRQVTPFYLQCNPPS